MSSAGYGDYDEPGFGYEPGCDLLPRDPEPDYEPSDADAALMRYLDLLGSPDSDGHYADPGIERLAGRWDPGQDDVAQMFAAVLYLLRTRPASRMRAVHVMAWLLTLLRVQLRAAVRGPFPRPRRAADGRPLDELSPSLPVLLARATLTAAPPARVPCQAGTAG